MTSAPSSRAPRAIPFGKYLLLERLHVGVSSEVFLGKAFGVGGFEKFVALKRVHGHLAHDAVANQRFVDEAKLLGKLSHAHITPVYELGKVGPTHYTVMEHVWGENLQTIIAKRAGEREPPVGMAALVGASLCDALHYAHTLRAKGEAAPIYHGDVEPRNVLMSYHGTIKLTGFALPGNVGADTGAAEQDGGSPYRSPERQAGAALDASSEVYSVAACVYELLTGRSPDDRGRASRAPTGTDTERSLLEFLTRCMASNRRTRPESVQELQPEFLRALRLDGRPFTTSRAADWMRHEFAESFERSKRRLNLYAELRSPDDFDVRATRRTPNDVFADDLLGITGAASEDEQSGSWDEAPTEIYFSSDARSSGEHIPVGVTSARLSSVELAPNALTPEPREQRRRRQVPRSGVATEHDALPNPILLRLQRTLQRAGLTPRWYVAGAFAVAVIGLVVWSASHQRGEGQIEIRERDGRPAEAWVDGVPRGQTPVRLEHVPTGTRHVELRADSGEAVAWDVVVRPNVTALVELSVLPEEQPDTNQPGRLTVTTIPAARMYVDGRSMGRRTPVDDIPISPGRHVLRLVADDGSSFEEEIFVQPGESLRMAHRFEP